jgi:hypothetical protein
MVADNRGGSERELTLEEAGSPSRRRLLSSIGWGLLAAATLGLAACESPHYDSDRGLFVLRPKK